MLQVQMSRTYCQGLQNRTEDEELKCPERYKNRYREWRWEEGFWRRSQVGMVQGISVNNAQNQYVISYQRNNKEKELNMQAKIKTKNGKESQIEVLVDSRCIHTGIDEKLVKDKRIQTELVDFTLEVFNADSTKNEEVIRMAPLEIKINGHKEQIDATVIDLNRMDMFLGHDWLVKHNSEVNWKEDEI